MLPGFRFLVAAIVLSMSLLIFGLGAAALLRAAHEEFASNPSWRAAPEVTFVQAPEATRPVLATLRVDLPVAEKQQDSMPAAAAPAEEAATAPDSTDASESQQIAAAKPEESSLEQVAKPEAVSAEASLEAGEKAAAGEAAPASAEKAANEEIPIAAIATSETSSADVTPVATENEQIVVQPAPATDSAATKIATLGGPSVDIATKPKAKVGAAKPDSARTEQTAVGKRVHAKHAANRRRIAAARARLAAQQAQLQLQLQANPFLQQPPPATHSR